MSRCGLLVIGRPTFDLEAAGKVATRARAALTRLGAVLVGPPGIVTSPEQAAEAARIFQVEKPETSILLCATFADARLALSGFGGHEGPIVLWAVREPGPVGDRLWLNSLCGANLAAHALVREGRRTHLIYGDPEEEPVLSALRAALHGPLPNGNAHPDEHGPARPVVPAPEALDQLRGQVIGAIGNVPDGFTSCEYDPIWLQSAFGLRVVRMDLDDALERMRATSSETGRAVAAEVLATTAGAERFPTRELESFGRVTRVLEDWRVQEGLDGLAMRCWPEVPEQMGACPCWALGRMAGDGVASACEVDVNGSATMLLLRAVGAAETFIGDTVRLDEAANTVTFWHCGSASPGLAEGSAEVAPHCNRRVGVAGNFALKPGRVTLARIGRSRSGPRFLLAGGDALARRNRFQGNSVEVQLDSSASDFVHALIEEGFEHHVVVGWAEVRPQVRWVAQQLGAQLVEFAPDPGRSA